MAAHTDTGTLDAEALAAGGAVHLASTAQALGTAESDLVAGIFAASAPHALDLTDDGWLLVLSAETVASLTVRRLAGYYEDVPLADLRLSLGKMLRTGCPVPPSLAATARIAEFLGAKVEGVGADLTGVDWMDPEPEEAAVYKAFRLAPGNRANPSTVCKDLDLSSNRTHFHDRVEPGCPFLLRDADRSEIRLVGAPANWSRPKDIGRFHWKSTSVDGSRHAVKLTLSQNMVESNSLNFPPDVSQSMLGVYAHAASGLEVDVHGGRKVKGLGPLIRAAAADYVDGQTALVLFDTDARTIAVELVNTHEAATEDAIVSSFLVPMPLAA